MPELKPKPPVIFPMRSFVPEPKPEPPIVISERPTATATPEQSLPGMPSTKQQSWGVVISIIIIVLMIVIGAFYAWGERISQNQNLPAGITQ